MVFYRYELKNAEYVEELPDGKHSTFGMGKTMPDKVDAHITDDGVAVPFGKGVKSGVTNSSLLYNEYIVYVLVVAPPPRHRFVRSSVHGGVCVCTAVGASNTLPFGEPRSLCLF